MSHRVGILFTLAALSQAIPAARSDEIEFGEPTEVRLTASSNYTKFLEFRLKAGERITVRAATPGEPQFWGEFLTSENQAPHNYNNFKGWDLVQGWRSQPVPGDGTYRLKLSSRINTTFRVVVDNPARRTRDRPEPGAGPRKTTENSGPGPEVEKLRGQVESISATNGQLLDEVKKLRDRVTLLEDRLKKLEGQPR